MIVASEVPLLVFEMNFDMSTYSVINHVLQYLVNFDPSLELMYLAYPFYLLVDFSCSSVKSCSNNFLLTQPASPLQCHQISL